MLVTPDGPVIVDVNPFPSFRRVPTLNLWPVTYGSWAWIGRARITLGFGAPVADAAHGFDNVLAESSSMAFAFTPRPKGNESGARPSADLPARSGELPP